MYEELVKDLRIYANDGTDEIRSQAADAIEELSREIKSLHKILGAHPDPKGKPGKPGVSLKEETE